MKNFLMLPRLKMCGILILSVFISVSAMAQTRTSSMYDDKCRLRHDTSLNISKALCETWSYAENNIAAYLSRVEIPKEYLESGFRVKHAVIASFECDSADVDKIKVLNDTTGYADAVKDCIKNQGKKIASELKQKSRSTQAGKYIGKYYVAFNFMLMNFNQQLRNGKAVPIIRGTIPMVETGHD